MCPTWYVPESAGRPVGCRLGLFWTLPERGNRSLSSCSYFPASSLKATLTCISLPTSSLVSR